MDKGQNFNELALRRYDITSRHNDGTQVNIPSYFSIGAASSTWELVMNTTYENLCTALQDHFPIAEGTGDQGSQSQSYRNHLSTLNSFLASVGKTLTSRVGVELGSAFDQSLKNYLDIIEVAPRTKRDRRNHLRLIRRLHEDWAANTRNEHSQAATSLSIELRTAIARTGLAPKTLAKQVHVSTSAMARWLKGAMPNKRGMPTLRRLETALDLPRDHLTRLVSNAAPATETATVVIPFRERLRELTRDQYVLPESELTPEFKTEWRMLFSFKTTPYTHLERAPRGNWRCIPIDTAPRMSPLVQAGSTVSPSAAIALGKLRSFIGALHAMTKVGSLLLDPEGLPQQTLAWLANPQALDAYLNWITARSGGVLHNGQKVFCRMVAGLVRPGTGYLWQSPVLAQRLPVSCRPATPEAWQQMCETSLKLVNTWRTQSNGVSRDPVQPIAALLALESPYQPILQAIEAIEQAAAAAPPGSVSEAILRRDALLLSMLLANPLRLRTLMSMTWSPQGMGSLRGNARTGWRIHLESHRLKNGSKQDHRDYDVAAAKWLSSRLEAYLEEYRSTLLGNQESPYLFVNARTRGIWEGMGARIRILTRRYIPGCPGFSAHAFRHLVATDWLTRYPNDYVTVSQLLHDKLETVMAHYAHLKRDTSFQRYEEHLNAMLACK